MRAINALIHPPGSTLHHLRPEIRLQVAEHILNSAYPLLDLIQIAGTRQAGTSPISDHKHRVFEVKVRQAMNLLKAVTQPHPVVDFTHAVSLGQIAVHGGKKNLRIAPTRSVTQSRQPITLNGLFRNALCTHQRV